MGNCKLQIANCKLQILTDCRCDDSRPHPACLDGANDCPLDAANNHFMRPHPPRADGEEDHWATVARESDSTTRQVVRTEPRP